MSGTNNAAWEARLTECTDALRLTQDRAVAGMHALEMMHDIRDPLETLGHLTYLMEREADDPDRVREYLRQAEEQMKEMRAIARESLETAATGATLTNLSEIASIALRRHRRRSDASRVHLVHDLEEGVTVRISASRMLRVISNLLANALDSLPAGGTVRLRVRRSEHEVHIQVTDNGHGIDAEDQERLFEPFFTTKKEKGTGLGLALSKRIVEEHSGRIRVRSCVRPGRSGTTFKVSLPA